MIIICYSVSLQKFDIVDPAEMELNHFYYKPFRVFPSRFNINGKLKKKTYCNILLYWMNLILGNCIAVLIKF